MDRRQPRSSNLRPHSSGQTSAPQPSYLSQINQSQPASERLIPGPAGDVQLAMRQRNLDRQRVSSQEPLIPTQEYVRRAIEDPKADKDFERSPWLSALELLNGDGMIPATPLNTVKGGCINGFDRINVVVAVVKTITRNEFGDAMVTLKDPTDTIGASIHHKVFTESEFGSDIVVGSVLILHQVVVFSLSRKAHYLNITISNVFKVFHKDFIPSDFS